MSTHNICFRREIRKISKFSDEKSTLFVAMLIATIFILNIHVTQHS